MKRTGWGILGSGAIADLFAEGLAWIPAAELAAVGSRTRANADSFAARHGAARAYGSYQELVADPAVDVVYVATPNPLHKEHALLAIAAGKPVLIEKPFALGAGDAAEVIAAARARSVFCMEAMWMRFSPAVRELQAQLRAGAIGEPRMLIAQLGFPYAFDGKNRLFQAEAGGGVLLDLGVYPLSLAVLLFGKPERVASQVQRSPSGADEQVTALLSYAGGRQAMIAASLRSPLSNDAQIGGTGGNARLRAPLYFPHAVSVLATGPHQPMRRGGRSAIARLKLHPWTRALVDLRARRRVRTLVRRARGNGYNHEAVEVMRCLHEGALESPQMPLDQSLQVMEIVDEIRRRWSPGGVP